MVRDSRYDILFEPVVIGPKVMKNKFYQAPHASGFSGDLYPAQRHGFGRLKQKVDGLSLTHQASQSIPNMTVGVPLRHTPAFGMMTTPVIGVLCVIPFIITAH